MTPADKSRLAELYSAGVPWREIEAKFGRSLISLNPLVRQMGLPRRNRYQTQWTRQGGHMRPWLFQRDDLERLALEGFEPCEIGDRLGRSADAVRQELRKTGLVTSTRAARICMAIEDWSASTSSISTIQLYDSALMKQRDIAQSLEVSEGQLRKWRHRHAVPKPIARKKTSKGSTARKDARSRMLPGYHDDHA